MKRNILQIAGILLISLLTLPAFSQTKQFGKTMKPVDDCNVKYGIGPDSIECVKSISLYRESYKNWKRSNNVQYMKDAFSHWKRAMFGCPCSTKNIYIDGERMLSYIIENPTDSTVKVTWYTAAGLSQEEIQGRWVDTLMMMFDRRIEAYGQECYVKGRKGVNLMQYAPDRYEMAFTELGAAFDCRDDESSARTMFEYFKATVLMVENNKLDTTELLEIYDAISTAAKIKIEEKGRDSSIYDLTLDEIDKAAKPYLTCEVIVPSYGSKFEANKNDLDFLRKVVKMLDEQGCTENDVYRKAAKRLYKLAPDSTAAFALAKMEHSLKNYSSCITYLKDAASAFKSPSSLEKVYLLMADSYSKLNNYSEARNAATKVLDYNPRNGNAYILIGDLYSNSASSCMYKELVVAYWVAADAYAQAASVDPSVADVANSRLASMKARFPTKAKIFFHSLSVGSSFTVECWINRSTIIRSSD